MKIVVAPNAFKESLSAREAAVAIAAGLKKSLKNAEIICVPVADGGDGTLEVLREAYAAKRYKLSVADPLGRPVEASCLFSSSQKIGLIEMAEASGLRMLSQAERNPMKTSTYGTGQLIHAAIERSAKELIVGIGGSATVDGGTGMAAALGYVFRDCDGREINPTGGTLDAIATIDPRPYQEWKKGISHWPKISVAVDVDNPLLGPRGASAVFAPQKGATPKQVADLERGLTHLARIVKRDLGSDMTHLKGGGAAGGLGAGLVSFLGAKIRPGVEIVLKAVKLEEAMKDANVVITGEGRLDGQTAEGKAPMAVARMARRYGVPTIGIAGSIGPGADRLIKSGHFAAMFSLCDGPMDLERAMREARSLLTQLSHSIGALLFFSKKVQN